MSDSSRYILAKKINRGGMAEIYLGKHVGEDGFQRLCAIKRILPHYAGDKEFIQMFRDEAHICKRLQHANIVRVEGFEEVEGSYAIIMEFVDGSDLRSVLHACEQAKLRMKIPMACHIIAESARGLHYAHTKVDEITQQPLGIVHRDISPQNIMLSFEGEVKVTDFGIADAESKITETRPGIVKGKYSYMSPEQISAKAIDARTDVFALSIVLWEMLAMRRLFQGQNEVETIQLVKNCKIDKKLTDLNSKVDEELAQIVGRGLAKDPKKRYGSAAEFEKDLRRFMSRKYPDFTPEDLGSFLKKILDKKRAENSADIKRTLTETSKKPTGRSAPKAPSEPKLMEAPEQGLAVNMAIQKNAPSATKSKLTMNRQAGAGARPQPAARSQFSRVNYGTNAASLFRQPQSTGNLPKVLLVGVAVAVLAFFAPALLEKFGLTSVATKPSLVIRTQPSVVKLSLNKFPLGNGKYVKASNKDPYGVELPKAGKYTLRVKRPGYQTYAYTFTAKPGQKIEKTDIVLNEFRKPAAVVLRLKNADTPTKIDIDDGYYTYTFRRRGLQASPPDLFPGRKYNMRVMNQQSGAFNCEMSFKTTNWKFPTVMIIDTKRKTCQPKTK